MPRLVFAFSLLLLVFANPAIAQDNVGMPPVGTMMVEPVATVIEIEGDVAVKGAMGEAAQLSIDAPIFQNDEILTGPESKVMLLFIDDTELTIGDNADVKINDFTFEPEDGGKKTAYLTFLRGAFLFVTGKIDKIQNPDVTLETPYASIGIRGTVVWGGTLDDEYNVFVQEGAVSVRNERGTMMVREGEGTTLKDRRTFPTKAKLWGEAKINRAVGTIALARTNEVKLMLEARRGKLLMDLQARRALRKQKLDDDGIPHEGDDLGKQGMMEERRDRQDKTGVNSNLKQQSERSKKSRNKDREEEFQRRIQQQRDNR